MIGTYRKKSIKVKLGVICVPNGHELYTIL